MHIRNHPSRLLSVAAQRMVKHVQQLVIVKSQAMLLPTTTRPINASNLIKDFVPNKSFCPKCVARQEEDAMMPLFGHPHLTQTMKLLMSPKMKIDEIHQITNCSSDH